MDPTSDRRRRRSWSEDGDARGQQGTLSRRKRQSVTSSDEENYSGRRRMDNDSEQKDSRRRHRDTDARDRRSRDHRERRKPSIEASPRRRERSRDRRGHESRSYQQSSRSPPAKKRRRSTSRSRSPPRRPRAPLPSQQELAPTGGGQGGAEGQPPVEKQKPNFKPTGLLAKEANTVVGTTTVLKYHEPPEARKPPPKDAWRMYIFKGKDLLDTIYLHQRSAWLMGRDAKVTDLLLEHPSISKQHAVVQFRHVTSTNEYGDKTSRVKPYLIDLDSANGTALNGKKVEGSRFVELVDQDVLSFGESEREYVVMLPKAEK